MPERYSCFSSFRAFVWQHRPRKAVLSRDSGAVLLRPFAAADLAERPLTEKVLWRNYLIIVGVFLAVFAFRAGFDIVHYGTENLRLRKRSPSSTPTTTKIRPPRRKN